MGTMSNAARIRALHAEGKTTREIAEIVGCSVGYARVCARQRDARGRSPYDDTYKGNAIARAGVENFSDNDLFRQELAPILTRHMMAAKGNPKKLAEIYEVLASSLGTAVAQGCGGNQEMMGTMLEGLSAHMMEVASERQPIMAFLSQFKR